MSTSQILVNNRVHSTSLTRRKRSSLKRTGVAPGKSSAGRTEIVSNVGSTNISRDQRDSRVIVVFVCKKGKSKAHGRGIQSVSHRYQCRRNCQQYSVSDGGEASTPDASNRTSKRIESATVEPEESSETVESAVVEK